MDKFINNPLGDGIHQVGTDENDAVCQVVDFDYSALDPAEPEPTIRVSLAASGLVRVLAWILRSHDLRLAGARAASIMALLDPVNSPFRNLSQIARSVGISRAALSKAILQLRDNDGVRFAGGKMDSSREIYRQAQLELVRTGRHASTKTRKTANMNVSEARKKFRTLHQAVNEIERLTTAQSSTPAQEGEKRSLYGYVAPEQMTLAQLKEQLDLANRAGDRQQIATLYTEILNRRRK
jgi:biotin operon repressor